MKLATKIFIYILTFILLSLALLHFALIYILPLDDVKNKIISTIEEKTNASVSIHKISASLFDFSLNQVDIKLKEEKILHIDNANIYFSLLHLLKGKIKVLSINLDTIEANIIKDERGHFNFEKLLKPTVAETEPAQTKKQEDTEDIINLLLCKTHIQNGTVKYIDQKNKLSLNISNISFYIEKFSFDQIFKLNASVKADATLNNRKFDSLYIALNSFITLHSMDFAKAKIDLDNFVIKFKNTVLISKGTLENFNSPVLNTNIQIRNLSSDILINITESPEFFIPELDIETKINADIDKGIIHMESFNVKTMDSSIDINGNLDYAGKNLIYNFDLSFNLLLEKIGNAVKMLQEYKPNGNLKGEFVITDKNLMQGTCNLIDISAFVSNLGYFTDINSNIIIKNIDNIKAPKFTGNLNKNPFLLEASYLTGKNSADISVLFRAKKILGTPDTAQKIAASKGKNTEKIKSETKKSSLHPLDIEVDFMADDIDTRFFKGKDIIFRMDLTGITPALDKVNGNMNFQSGQGTIKDLYKLTNSNALMKGLFLSLDIVSRVINALNVLDILNSIGSAIFTSNTENAGAIDGQPEQKHKLDGKMDFDSFITFLNFSNGKATFEKCSFISDLLSFKVTGEMDFKKDKLDMTVHTAPGKHDDDGIMPLTMTITGTIEEPNGSLSLLGSVYSVVSQSLLNNAVSDGLKKGFVNLLGLKKHDEKGNEIQDVNISTNTFTPNYQPTEPQK
ncbi:MAG: AsmA family protein [Endomicrobiaceae bacterium]|nr:AsmA family protein [Endomicrobiaceae bacterium]